MVYVKYVDGDEDVFETKKDSEPWKWIPDQQAYLIPSIEGDVVIPAGFIKNLKHHDCRMVKPTILPAIGKRTYACPKCGWISFENLLDGGEKSERCPKCGIGFDWND